MSLRLGSTIISGIGTEKVSNAHNLLDFKWSDHIINSMEWLRSDTFSWQSGDVYNAVYEHLMTDIIDATEQSETIGTYTIYYKLSKDGHKVCGPDQESVIINVFNDYGVTWYYILDEANTRFKLPRTKYGFTGLRDAAGNYIPESLPNITGGIDWVMSYSGGTRGAFYLRSNENGNTGSGTSAGRNFNFDASRCSSTYQDGAPVQQRATQMYLYFYVGQFSQSATEQTAGITTETLNMKADKSEVWTPTSTTQAQKETIISWGMPDYSAMVSKTKGTTYTAETDGYLIGYDKYDATGGSSAYVYINGINVRIDSSQDDYAKNTWCYPIAKGSTYSYSGSANMGMRFVPCKGVV